jgi:hypothetical protein
MSPRAACRLATLGFERVFDYTPGKVDWIARALPTEGGKASEPRAVHLAVHDFVTCGLDDALGEVRKRVEGSPYGFALVTSEDDVLLGRLRKRHLERDDASIGSIMEPGPSTFRPDTAPDQLLGRLHARDLTTAVLTDPEGRLLGLVRRRDLEPRE